MKPWIILIVLAVTLTAAFTVAAPLLWDRSTPGELSIPAPPKPDGPSPVAEVVEDLLFNFGTLPQWITGQHTWTFKNTGLGPLELRGAGTTCSCTSATLFSGDKKKEGKDVILKPGESLPVEVTFETKNWNPFHQSVTIGTNDPNRPTIVLTIDGIAKPAVTTIPADPGITFGVVSNETETVRRIILFSDDRPDLKILNLTSTNPKLIAVTSHPLTPEEAKSIKAEKAHFIELTLKPTANLGSFAEEIVVETDHPQKSELKFKVTGKITGPITVVPGEVTVQNATASRGGTQTLKIVVRGRSSVQFIVEKKPPAFNVSIELIPPAPGAKGSLYKMVVNLNPGTDPGRIVDEIILKTDDPTATEVKVPVNVLVLGTR